jgi:hypothetical protein
LSSGLAWISSRLCQRDLAGFVGDSTSMPLLQGGKAIVFFAHLVWVNPMIAGFGAIPCLPQIFIVPRTQHGINRNSAAYAKVLSI